jgi:hypothetical protein
MDIGAASALNLYAYQTTLQNLSQGTATSTTATSTSSSTNSSSAQNEAVLQTLTAAYSDYATGSSGLLPSTDSLSALAGSSSLASLVSGIYSAAAANGNTNFPITGLSTSLSTMVGGLDSTTASSLLSGVGSGGLEGLSTSAVSPDAALALAAYSNYENNVPTTLSVAATAAASSTDSSQPSSVQAAVQAAQSASYTSTLNLLG